MIMIISSIFNLSITDYLSLHSLVDCRVLLNLKFTNGLLCGNLDSSFIISLINIKVT